jgi:hypothetical protein
LDKIAYDTEETEHKCPICGHWVICGPGMSSEDKAKMAAGYQRTYSAWPDHIFGHAVGVEIPDWEDLDDSERKAAIIDAATKFINKFIKDNADIIKANKRMDPGAELTLEVL